MTAHKVDRADRGRRGARDHHEPVAASKTPSAATSGLAVMSGSGLVHWRDAGAERPLCGRLGEYRDFDTRPGVVTCKDCRKALDA